MKSNLKPETDGRLSSAIFTSIARARLRKTAHRPHCIAPLRRLDMESPSQETVGVITASSTSGAACVQALLSKHSKTKIRAIFRTEAKAAMLPECDRMQPNLKIVTGVDASAPETLVKALSGCTVAFLVTPWDPSRGIADDATLVTNMISAAAEAGVRHVVFCGSWTVNQPEKVSGLARRFLPAEELLKTLEKDRGMTWTSLRGGFFYNNFRDLLGSLKTSDEVKFVDFCVPANDARDIGRVAAAVASKGGRGFEGKVFEISGPERLWMGDVANVFGCVLGRDIKFVKVPAEECLSGFPDFLKQGFEYLAEAGEKAVPLSNDVEMITGQPAVSLAHWVAEHQGDFEKSE